ncbi:hypothetical protein ACFE04_008743 [Oxalis oulophora]
MEFLKGKLGFCHGFMVAANGRRGGIACLWNTDKNNNRVRNEIFERLDRVVVNERWSLMFPNAVVSILASSIYDHLPVMLNTQKLLGWRAREKGFKFENVWLESSSEFGSIIVSIKHKQFLLKELLNNRDVRRVSANIGRVEEELNSLLDMEDKLWRQRAKVLWQEEGDRNIAFFHACAT